MVEKDYVLSKALMALAQDDFFQNIFLFKGGTALKKCFYPNWRFSEDLGFTSKERLESKDIKSIFQKTVDKAGRLFGLSMKVIEYSQYPKSDSRPISAQLKLGYDGPLRKSSGQKNNIRVDIALEEVIVSSPDTKKIFKIYTDDIDAQLPTYPLEEIVAEKLRSILQRGKSRDYYDVWILLKDYDKDFSFDKMWSIFKKKCQYKKIPVPKVDDFFLPQRTEEAGRYWERGLAHQVANLADYRLTLNELKELLTKSLVEK